MTPSECEQIRCDLRVLRDLIQGENGILVRLARIEEQLGMHSLNWEKVWRLIEIPLAAAVGATVAKLF